MISNSDIIVKAIENKGYTLSSFIEKSGIAERTMYNAISENCWTKPTIDKVSATLGVDLSSFINAKLGAIRDVNNRN